MAKNKIATFIFHNANAALKRFPARNANKKPRYVLLFQPHTCTLAERITKSIVHNSYYHNAAIIQFLFLTLWIIGLLTTWVLYAILWKHPAGRVIRTSTTIKVPKLNAPR